jgi:hypothetical protein
MNTHADGLYETTLYKRKTVVNLESATPTVDQPSVRVDGREVDNDVVVPLPTMAWSTATMLPLLLSQTTTKALEEKRQEQQ